MIKKFYIVLFSLFFYNALFGAEDSLPGPLDQESVSGNVFLEAQNKKLRWKLKTGDVIEIRKKTRQNIVLTDSEKTRTLFEPREINRDVYYRIVLHTIAVDPIKGYLQDGAFYTLISYQLNDLNLYQEENSEDSSFYIQPRGIFIVPPGTFMPNVRDIPVFPRDSDPGDANATMKEGYSWSFPGTEIMRLEELESIPLKVKYEYRGMEIINVNKKEKPVHKILYNVEFNHTFKKSQNPENPRLIFGYVTSKLLWDEIEGMPYFMTEDYDIVTILNNGQSQEFKISGKTNYHKKVHITAREKESLRKDLADNLQSSLQGVNLQVKSNKKGISIQIPDILFSHDSSELSRDSMEILKKVGSIIEKYAHENNILVRGHTDNVGIENYNEELSRKRALSVAGYLSNQFRIPSDLISFEGVGSKFPISDNETPNGRQKNRRVEITILDK